VFAADKTSSNGLTVIQLRFSKEELGNQDFALIETTSFPA
jgi:hypothetical protein